MESVPSRPRRAHRATIVEQASSNSCSVPIADSITACPATPRRSSNLFSRPRFATGAHFNGRLPAGTERARERVLAEERRRFDPALSGVLQAAPVLSSGARVAHADGARAAARGRRTNGERAAPERHDDESEMMLRILGGTRESPTSCAETGTLTSLGIDERIGASGARLDRSSESQTLFEFSGLMASGSREVEPAKAEPAS